MLQRRVGTITSPGYGVLCRLMHGKRSVCERLLWHNFTYGCYIRRPCTGLVHLHATLAIRPCCLLRNSHSTGLAQESRWTKPLRILFGHSHPDHPGAPPPGLLTHGEILEYIELFGYAVCNDESSTGVEDESPWMDLVTNGLLVRRRAS